jgi:nickel-dependent lactate racemase
LLVQQLRYGSQEFGLSLKQGRPVALLEPNTPPPANSPGEIVRRCLEQPYGSPPLREIARGKRSAAILIPGKERVAGTAEYVPALISELNRAGIPDGNIEVFLATGTHEHHGVGDVVDLLGEEVASRVQCRAHDCFAESELSEVGRTSFGTPVLINQRVLEAEVKILTGRIMPHYFAGFSGGRKALIPGVAGFQTIRANHRLTLDAQRGIHPGVGPCLLEENPVHLDMLEGTRMVRPDFSLNTLLDTDHRIVAAVAGDFEAAHEEGCRQAARLFRLSVAEPVDVLITSAGGHPYDYNFMQSLKAVFNVEDIVRPGGAILWIAECPRGIHPDFLRWCSITSDEELDEAVRENYNLKGHNSLMLRRLTRRAEVALWSTLPEDEVRALGVHPLGSLAEGIEWIGERVSGDFSCAVVPHANAVAATVEHKTPAELLRERSLRQSTDVA